MRAADQRRMTVNRRMWDESVPLHLASRSYDVPGFRSGRNPLARVELEELGPVRGRSLLHLQCHFGMDTLAWARLGARVTGVDFSPPAIRAARELADELGVNARFVRSNVYDARRHLPGRFDIVYTGKGALCWLPSLPRWAEIVARFLNPGGRFFLLEDHPIAETYGNGRGVKRLRLQHPYFQRGPLRDESEGTYAAPTARLRNSLSFSWTHPLSLVLDALINSGLRVQSVREYPYTYWRRFPFMHEEPDGYWHLDREEGLIPLMYSVRAERPRSRP